MGTLRLHGCIGKQLGKILLFLKSRLFNCHIMLCTGFVAAILYNQFIFPFPPSQRKLFIIKICDQTVQNIIQLFLQCICRGFLIENPLKICQNIRMQVGSLQNILQYRPGFAVFSQIGVGIILQWFALEIDGIRPLFGLLLCKAWLLRQMIHPFPHLTGDNALRI